MSKRPKPLTRRRPGRIPPKRQPRGRPITPRGNRLGLRTPSSTATAATAVQVSEPSVETAKKPNRPKRIVFASSDLVKKTNYEAHVVYSCRDFSIFLIFLIVTAMITFGTTDLTGNYYGNIVHDILGETGFTSPIRNHTINLPDVLTTSELFAFIREVFAKTVFEDTEDHPGTRLEGIRFLKENVIVGAPRVRLLRVQNDTCTTVPLFADLYKTCYDYYSSSIEDVSFFGAAETQTAFVYQEPSKYEDTYNGLVSSYNGGGFQFNFTRDLILTSNWLRDMEKNDWLKIGARAVFVDFTLFTPNANLFCIVKVLFEIIPTGGMLPSLDIRTAKLVRYVDKWDFFVLSCEVLFVVFTIYYTAVEVEELLILRFSYFQNPWNILDVAIVFCANVVILLGVVRFTKVNLAMSHHLSKIYTQEHVSFDTMSNIQTEFNTAAAVLTFFVWLKLLKFSTISHSVTLLFRTFECARLELFTFFLGVMASIAGFACLAHIMYGAHVSDFRTYGRSYFSLASLFVAGMHFVVECQYAHPVATFFFFAVYLLFVYIILVGGIVAIIIDGLEKAVLEMKDDRKHVYLSDLCLQMLMRLCTFCGRRRSVERMDEKRQKKIFLNDYDALAEILRRHGIRGLELSLVFQKHGIVAGEQITLEQMVACYNDVILRKQLTRENEDHTSIIQQMEKINRTIEYVYLSLSDIVTKVDILSNNLGKLK